MRFVATTAALVACAAAVPIVDFNGGLGGDELLTKRTAKPWSKIGVINTPVNPAVARRQGMSVTQLLQYGQRLNLLQQIGRAHV